MNKNRVLQLCDFVTKIGATEAKPIPIGSIEVEPWVQLKCLYGCPRYGKSKTCPPFSPKYEDTRVILASYKQAILIEGQPPGREFSEMLLKLELKANVAGYHKAFAMGAGPCPLCPECPPDKPCIKPSEARPSMESCGIDVFQTVRNNGFQINFLEKKGTYVKYVGLLLLEYSNKFSR